MKTNIATNRSQGDRLLRCGVSADTADMFYQTPITASQKETREDILLVRKADKTLFDTDIPAWSLSALLGLLPKRIKRGDCSNYTLSLSCDGCFWNLEYTYARYCGEDDSLVLFEDADPIGACVKAIEWLIERGYKLNEQ